MIFGIRYSTLVASSQKKTAYSYEFPSSTTRFMSLHVKNFCELAAQDETRLTFVRKLTGSTGSILVCDEQDRLWATKLKRKSTLDNELANEFIGSYLCKMLGLPVPEARVLRIPQDFLADENFYSEDSREWISPYQGDHFASRFLPNCFRSAMAEIVPPTLHSKILNLDECVGMFVFDVWALNTDCRQALFEVTAAGLRATFIDHGSLFGGASWQEAALRIDTRCSRRAVLNAPDLASRLEDWVLRMQYVIPGAFADALDQLPEGWSYGDVTHLRSVFLRRLRRLRDYIAKALMELFQKTEQMVADPVFSSLGQDVLMLSPDGSSAWYPI